MDPIVKINHLSYKYPDGTLALKDIFVNVLPGEKIALVGSNGAGKSTLLLHLNGILEGSGEIFIDGMKIEKKNIGVIRARVGVVFQNPDDQLFSSTVFEDVAYGPIYQGFGKTEVKTKVDQALADVHMQDFSGRNPYHLSGGEKKRIAIATVLSMNPQILVLDEPTAGLDPRSRRNLIELLLELPHTMLIATHDLDMVEKLTPRTILLNQGQIIADSSTSSILGDDNLLEINGLK